jgi:hypothetical protein
MWMINQKLRRSAAFALYVDFRVFVGSKFAEFVIKDADIPHI